MTGAVGMYQARPPVSVSMAAHAPGPHVVRVVRRAGRDTSWGIVTRAVGMYQARPLSVSDASASRWRPAGSARPIRVSHEIACLGALHQGAVGLAPNSQCESSSFDLISEVDFHRSDVDGPGYTVGKYQARWVPGRDTCCQAGWH